ncbi:hypothetical protein QBC46DRAFT_390935 [Diplogelasinospora grovesii]|uniref:2EXR domain-containing protein n=1 Tax=Diplogelasinospora grovesii TaxID=303347 RepID=A0AAN6N2Z6_9PEZI|nr:hypothetical protein QBC46DRAFT_390935 [Diplogelasinospora grovesii]
MASTFPRFPELPTELRLTIWRLCLPHRVAELDSPDEEDINGEAENCGGCWLTQTSKLNALPPVLTRVCRESRMVAMEHAGYLIDDEGIDVALRDVSPFGTSLADVTWVDKRRDVVHLNWWGWYDGPFNRHMDPIPLWLAAAARAQGASLRTSLLVCELNQGVWDDRREEMTNHDELVRDTTLLVCLRIVTIHAPLQPAAESGLFGLLGDERITLVDATDTARKEQYRAFWEQHGRRPDLNPYRFFTKWSRENEWAQDEAEALETHWLVSRWFKVRDSVADSATAWKKQPEHASEGTISAMDAMEVKEHWTPNREHPWVKDTRTALPKIRPMVMFRLCTTDCHGEREKWGWKNGVDFFDEGYAEQEPLIGYLIPG